MGRRGPKPRSVIERFWENVDRDELGGCWEWVGKSTRGYGLLAISGRRQVKAHRLSALIHFGMFDRRAWVLHHCDNSLCVNPDHLYLGDHVQNMTDMRERQRGHWTKQTACRNGHPYSESNTRRRSNGTRQCLTCARRKWNASNARRRGGAA